MHPPPPRRRRAHRTPGALAAAVVLVVALAGCRPLLPLGDEPIGQPSPSSELVGCDRAAELVVLTADAHLDPGCTYTGGFEITASDTTLDCRGARIHDPSGTRSRGVHVHAPNDVRLERITVRSCIISGFLNNIRVSRDDWRELEQGADYDAPFADIVIENNRLLDSRGSGLFVNAFVTDVTVQDNEISRSGSVGIYLEASSRDNVVRRNGIHDNGYGEVDPVNGVPQVVEGVELRVHMTGREGIAVDGSRGNVITDNTISGNSAGGIFLYKNCGEYATERPGQWWERWYGADDNLIEGNRIWDEDDGIWVGSRMAENQRFMDCSDPTYASGPLLAIHRDVARGNTLRGNVLAGVTNAIRVEDDDTVVEGNTIMLLLGREERGVLVGSKERTERLDDPVSGTVVRDNQVLDAHLVPGFAPYGWVHGHEGTVVEGNLVDGEPADLVPGTQPPIGPFLFVVRAWLP